MSTMGTPLSEKMSLMRLLSFRAGEEFAKLPVSVVLALVAPPSSFASVAVPPDTAPLYARTVES